jgi:hypothetical protein
MTTLPAANAVLGVQSAAKRLNDQRECGDRSQPPNHAEAPVSHRSAARADIGDVGFRILANQ